MQLYNNKAIQKAHEDILKADFDSYIEMALQMKKIYPNGW